MYVSKKKLQSLANYNNIREEKHKKGVNNYIFTMISITVCAQVFGKYASVGWDKICFDPDLYRLLASVCENVSNIDE